MSFNSVAVRKVVEGLNPDELCELLKKYDEVIRKVDTQAYITEIIPETELGCDTGLYKVIFESKVFDKLAPGYIELRQLFERGEEELGVLLDEMGKR